MQSWIWRIRNNSKKKNLRINETGFQIPMDWYYSFPSSLIPSSSSSFFVLFSIMSAQREKEREREKTRFMISVWKGRTKEKKRKSRGETEELGMAEAERPPERQTDSHYSFSLLTMPTPSFYLFI